MTSFRFLHAADIHLDSPLIGLAGQEGNAAERIRTATREALRNLVGLAIDEHVDFVIIAGDLYDGDWRDYQTGLFFVGQMGCLSKANIPVYVLHGNHDAESQITRSLSLPENVRVFDARKPATFELDKVGVALHGQSYPQRDVTHNLVDNYPGPRPGSFNIGVLHTGLGGLGGHANYAPCRLSELVNKGYDYWVLGHVHSAQILNERPHVVFPGNLQGRHVREVGPKGACLVTVEGQEIIDFAHLPCDVVRWAVLSVSLESVNHFAAVTDCIRQAMHNAIADQADGRLLACRIILEGCTDVHPQLLVSADQILAEAQASALSFGDEVAWVEKVKIATRPKGQLQSDGGPIEDLQNLLAEAETDEEFLAVIASEIGDLKSRLPYESQSGVEDKYLKLAISGEYAQLLGEIRPYLLARLNSAES